MSGIGGCKRGPITLNDDAVCKEWKRTHLRKSARGCIYGTSEGRQSEEGALEDKVDERVKRLSFRFSVFKIEHYYVVHMDFFFGRRLYRNHKWKMN